MTLARRRPDRGRARPSRASRPPRPRGRRLVRLLCAGGTLLAAWSAGVASAGVAVTAVVTQAAYLAHVVAARDLARDGMTQPGPDLMVRVRATLGLPLVVRGDDGSTVAVPADPVLERLQGIDAADFRAAVAELRAIGAGASAALANQAPDPSKLRAQVTNAYRNLTPNPGFLERLRTDLGQALGWIVSRLFADHGAASVVVWLLLAGGLVLLLFLVSRALGFPRFGIVQERTVASGDATSPRTPADWDALADAALRRGDRGAAVRALYGKLLARLSARGVVPDVPSLTAGECRLAVSVARPAIAPLVARATDAFERVSYGDEPVGDDDLDSLRRAADAA